MIRYSLLFSESLDNFFLKKDDEEKIRNISLGKKEFSFKLMQKKELKIIFLRTTDLVLLY